MTHPEAVFFIDNQRPKSLNLTSLCSSLCVPIRIRFSLPPLPQGFASALWRCGKGDHFDTYRPVGETVAEVVVSCCARRVVGTNTATCLWLSTPGKRRASPLLFYQSQHRRTPTIHCQRLTHVAKYRINGLRRSGVVSNGKLSQNN